MTEYTAPLKDMLFVLRYLCGLDDLSQLPGCEDLSAELAAQVLEESGRFASGVLSPLNAVGDREGAHWEQGVVRMPAGFAPAYRQFIDAGWNSLPFPAEYGGQGLPRLLAAPVMEMWKSANLSFSLCPMLTSGAIEALLLRGTALQKQTYLPPMIEGRWTGTMNLTEPQAGSDLSLVNTRAEPVSPDAASDFADGARLAPGEHYRLHGQKIFITYGDHDLAENIIHLVLARTPGAPEGVRGLSLFIVPKYLPDAQGKPSLRNDVHCASIEHKLGIHASPTAVMLFGSGVGEVGAGAVGYRLGTLHHGLETMFIMMNAARFAVGMEGLALAERAMQQAVSYARDRRQSRDLSGAPGAVPIIRHPDVRRMLLSLRSQVEAMRALAYVVAAAMDVAHQHPDAAERARQQAFVDLMIPIVKGWNTENAVELSSLGVQVHGGMGFIEETGAAQLLRDSRITTIYEGTTGIQANDLVGRKILRDGGKAVRAWMATMRDDQSALQLRLQSADAVTPAQKDNALRLAGVLDGALQSLQHCVDWILQSPQDAPRHLSAVYAGAVPMLTLCGLVAGGWQLSRSVEVVLRLLDDDATTDRDFLEAKLHTASFYAEHALRRVQGLAASVMGGADAVLDMPESQF